MMRSSIDAMRDLSRPRLWEFVVLVLAFAAPLLVPSHALMVNEIAIVALFAVSLDLVLGFAGIVSLGHAAFFGFGAYAAAFAVAKVKIRTFYTQIIVQFFFKRFIKYTFTWGF
jgi:ABC-type branched-subunit amino acid transport system permease subunit